MVKMDPPSEWLLRERQRQAELDRQYEFDRERELDRQLEQERVEEWDREAEVERITHKFGSVARYDRLREREQSLLRSLASHARSRPDEATIAELDAHNRLGADLERQWRVAHEELATGESTPDASD